MTAPTSAARDVPPCARLRAAAAAGGGVSVAEVRHRKKDWTVFDVQRHVHP